MATTDLITSLLKDFKINFSAMYKHILIILIGLISFAQKPIKIKPTKSFIIEVTEPSDICLNPHNPKHYFVASDDGYLHEMNREGKITRTADFKGLDVEAVCMMGDDLLVVEEFTRKINVFDSKTLELKRSIVIPYGGGRNKGYEAIAYNPLKDVVVLTTEKSPSWIFELDKNLNVVNQFEIKISRDISAATFYNDHLWLLSDEDRTVFKLNEKYEVIQSWIVPVINPEGMAFDEDGTLLILSDNMQRLYFFNAID